MFEGLPELANFKFKFGFSWENIFKLYAYGVKSIARFTDSLYEKVLRKTKGVHKLHLERAYVKVKRELEKGNVYLLNPLPFLEKRNIVVLDTEYSDQGVLYGFLDLSSGNLERFWFNEIEKATNFLNEKKNCIFVHWGGADAKLLREELKCNANTLNLLYYIQTSLVAPISTATLIHVHDALYGHVNEEWWLKAFYTMDGLYKRILCNRILKDLNDEKAKSDLINDNKADIIALYHIILKLFELARFHLPPKSD